MGTKDDGNGYTKHRAKRAGNSRLESNVLLFSLPTFLYVLTDITFNRNNVLSQFCHFSTTAIESKWQERETSLWS